MPYSLPAIVEANQRGQTFFNYAGVNSKVPLPALDRSQGASFTFIAVHGNIILTSVEKEAIEQDDGSRCNTYTVSYQTTIYNLGGEYWFPVSIPRPTQPSPADNKETSNVSDTA